MLKQNVAIKLPQVRLTLNKNLTVTTLGNFVIFPKQGNDTLSLFFLFELYISSDFLSSRVLAPEQYPLGEMLHAKHQINNTHRGHVLFWFFSRLPQNFPPSLWAACLWARKLTIPNRPIRRPRSVRPLVPLKTEKHLSDRPDWTVQGHFHLNSSTVKGTHHGFLQIGSVVCC